MGQLTLVRHGQASLFGSDYDHLSALGRVQAQKLGEHWSARDVRFDAVYTGPASRQRDTATMVAKVMAERGRPWPEIVVLPELDEHDAFGLITKAVPRLGDDPEVARLGREVAAGGGDAKARSRAFQRLFEAVMARWLEGAVDVDVETWPDFRARVHRGLTRIVEAAPKGYRVAAFTSVGPIAVSLMAALQTSALASFRTAWRIRNASITRFAFGRGMLTLDAFNLLEHLPDADLRTFR